MTTRIVIFTVGTEGDARPYVALGRGLASCGYDVVIATSREFEDFVRRNALGFAPLTADFYELMQRHRNVIDRRSQWRMMRTLMDEVRRMARSWAEEGMAAADGAALIIGSGNVALLATSVGEKLGTPVVRSQLQPFDPSRDLPAPLFRPSRMKLPGAVNLLLYQALRIAAWRLMRQAIQGVRADLMLPPYPATGPWSLLRKASGRTLYGFSRHVVPRQPEWPASVSIPGYFMLPEAARYQPSPALKHFLETGPRPIYIGFGSMVSARIAALAGLVGEAVRLSGSRAIVSSGWAEMGAHLGASADIMVVTSVPHDWLFPQVSLAVHHCGAGTTAAAISAGIPTVPVPFVGDQFFWAWQMRRLGVATAHLERRRLTAQSLADAIEQARQPTIVAAASALGAMVRAEDGVAAAIGQLREWGMLPDHRPVAPLQDEAGLLAAGAA